ncbi:hypothetical protein G6O67_008698 [Ophiocordyceps sinensis]|uniref:Uncharacterized protein n=2 Tax=Ophiocordyceps sinensis TaxID=72228 RepID=A0A8H4PJU8_9HYPO|nr:Protein kinase-like domain protein [Ophiocordyceps sinensis CO18]KAF4504084.1 hypothetical protein G6O67_008698 [Ophiocordyceps sinensis]
MADEKTLLGQNDGVCDAFDIGNGIVFENHPHAIGEVAEEVVAREDPSTPPQAPVHRRDRHKLRPDQICVYRSALRAGLRPMNIYKEVVNRNTIPPSADPDGLAKFHAEKLTASALTQTYHYMMEGGLEYGLLTTGEATVFLKVD